MLHLWRRRPVLVRALVACLLVLVIGGQPWQALLALNLRIAPGVPWSLPLGLAWLALVLLWLRGAGPPVSTRAPRRAGLRAEPVPAATWRATLAIGAIGWCGLLLHEIALLRALGVPRSAPFPPELTLASARTFAFRAAFEAGVVAVRRTASGSVEEKARGRYPRASEGVRRTCRRIGQRAGSTSIRYSLRGASLP